MVDVGLPDGSGIALVGELRAAGWPRLVVLSAAEDPYTVRAALVAGVQGYLLKPRPRSVVADGVRRVLDGGVTPTRRWPRCWPPAARRPGDAARRAVRPRGRGAPAGRRRPSNKEIGEALGLSALTVKSHLARIARKLGTGDRAEMVAVAMRAGVIR